MEEAIYQICHMSVYLFALNKIVCRCKYFGIKNSFGYVTNNIITLQTEVSSFELEVLPSVTVKSTVFWPVKLCSLENVQCFGETCHPFKEQTK
jgi:hypothetical protein